MYLQRYNAVGAAFKTAKMLLFVYMLIGMHHLAHAQDTEQAPIETVEEIIVYGDQSMRSLRLSVFAAQEKFFAVFSALNNDDEYDIRCFYETPSGSRLRQHVCRAHFVSNARAAEAAAGSRYPTMPASAVIQSKKRILRQKMDVLMTVDAELNVALTEYTLTREIYELEREKRYPR